MQINFKVKTLDAQTHDFCIDNEITVREFKDRVEEKTSISAEQQRIIYCGRVMADERQLKDYDIDGKVVHVAERPPPSQRVVESAPRAQRPSRTNMRNSPLFRALDGMANTAPVAVNPYRSSSSFCMNRITVARHMLDCANNIAAYLEDPTRGLNNTSLDILARGRWTMESTVVEVGITAADLPQNHNIVEMVQGAVSAALRRNGNANVTVLQLPSVFGTTEGGHAVDAGDEHELELNAVDLHAIDAANGRQRHAAVIIEDVDDEANDLAAQSGAVAGVVVTGTNSEVDNGAATTTTQTFSLEIDTQAAQTTAATYATQTGPVTEVASSGGAATTSSNSVAGDGTADSRRPVSVSTGTNTDDAPSRRRTGTNVLAEVILRMRTVQDRLGPFIQQFYELLLNDPTFAQDDTPGREEAQRLYDRVSEALHYMSHAQHAISDLMLDVSQPAPRYLTCRPILVEQSGYVSSNNYNLSAAAAAAAASAMRQSQQQTAQQNVPLRQSPLAAAATVSTSPQPVNNSTTSGTNTTTTTTSPTSGAATRAEADAGSETDVDAEAAIAAAAGAVPDLEAGAVSSDSGVSARSNAGSATEDPIDDPVVLAGISAPASGVGLGANPSTGATRNNANPIRSMNGGANPINDENSVEIVLQPRRGLYFGNNQQMQMARLIQAVVNSAPIDTEFHVQINAPSILSFGMPMNGGRNNGQAAGAGSSAAGGVAAAGGAAGGAAAMLGPGGGNTNSNMVTVNPNGTIGNLPSGAFNGRFVPANMMSSFDRFLPCNSHHIRESNPTNDDNNTNNARAAAATLTGNAATLPAGGINVANMSGINTATGSAPPAVSAAMAAMAAAASGNYPLNRGMAGTASTPAAATATAAASASASTTASSAAAASAPSSSRGLLRSRAPPAATRQTVATILPNLWQNANDVEERCRNLRRQLLKFLHLKLFAGSPITASTIPAAVQLAFVWFAGHLRFLPQFEKRGYDARDSLLQLMRHSLAELIEFINDSGYMRLVDFELQLRQLVELLRTRLYSVLHVCIGTSNAQIYWSQLIRQLQVSINANFRDESLQFLSQYLNADLPVSADVEDAQQFIVCRFAEPMETDGGDGPEEVGEPVVLDMTPAVAEATGTVSMPDDGPATASPTATASASASAARGDNDSIAAAVAAELANCPIPVGLAALLDGPDDSDDSDLFDEQNEANRPPPIELPTVEEGSEPWHRHFPQSWLPCLTRDIRRQAEHPATRTPYSDAYIAGMSTKRRKMILARKPPTDFKQLVASSVRTAIQRVAPTPVGTTASTSSAATAATPSSSTAATSAANRQNEQICSAIAGDSAVRSSIVEAVRNNVVDRFKKDPTLKQDNKYPKAAKFIEK